MSVNASSALGAKGLAGLVKSDACFNVPRKCLEASPNWAPTRTENRRSQIRRTKAAQEGADSLGFLAAGAEAIARAGNGVARVGVVIMKSTMHCAIVRFYC